MIRQLETLLWDAEANQVREFEKIDKRLLEAIFQEAFAQELNRNCQNCLQDAYWQLRVLRKKLLSPMQLKKHKVIKPFEFQSVQLGVLTEANITDELAEKLLKQAPYMSQYIQLEKIDKAKNESAN